MFEKVTRERNLLRLALDGPAGSGKTYTALRFAFGIAKREGGRVAVLDTEHNSASLYAGESPDGVPWEWDQVAPQHFAPSMYTQVIEEAGRAGYKVLVIDSLSHAWMGTGGALDQVDRGKARQGGGGSFGAWRDVTPQHNAMIDAILRSPCHIIATLRTKTEYALGEDERGKTKVEKLGMKPIQRDGVEYEFTIVCDLDQDHKLSVSKTRCPLIDGKIVKNPTADFLNPVLDWLYKGVPAAAKESGPRNGNSISMGKPSLVHDGHANRIKELWRGLGKRPEDLKAFLEKRGVSKIVELDKDTVEKLTRRLEALDMKNQAEEVF